MAKKTTAKESINQYLSRVMRGDVKHIDKSRLPVCLDGMICTGFLAPRDPLVRIGEEFQLGKGMAARIVDIQPIYGGRAAYSFYFFYLH